MFNNQNNISSLNNYFNIVSVSDFLFPLFVPEEHVTQQYAPTTYIVYHYLYYLLIYH